MNNKKVMDRKEIHMSQVSGMLKDLVERRSENPPGEEAAVSDWMEQYLTDRDIPFIRQEVLPGRCNLVARLEGDDPHPLIFTGHMDVVPVSPAERHRWHSDPYQAMIRNGRLYGRGATDMKAGLAAALAALSALKASGIRPPHDILLAATIDEEDRMRGSAAMVQAGLIGTPAGVIVCEPTGLTICSSSRGRTFGTLQFQGQTGHGSDPGSSLNAIDLAYEFIREMKEVRFPQEPGDGSDRTFWQALSIQAGVEPSVVPDQCRLGIDARLALGYSPTGIWEEADRIVERLKSRYPAMICEIIREDEREPWTTSPTDPFLVQFEHSCRELGLPVEHRTFPGTTDGTKLRRSGCPCLIVGPGELALAHRENESVALAEVEQAVLLYQHFMEHFMGNR